MNYFDVIIGVIFLYAAFRGFTKGFIFQLAGLVALIAGIFLAIKFNQYVASLLSQWFKTDSKYISLASFAVIFIGVLMLVNLTGKLVQKIAEAVALGLLNRFAGLLFSVMKFGLFVSILLVYVNRIDERLHIIPQEDKDKSLLYKPLSDFAPLIFPYFDIIKKDLPLPKEEKENKDDNSEEHSGNGVQT